MYVLRTPYHIVSSTKHGFNHRWQGAHPLAQQRGIVAGEIWITARKQAMIEACAAGDHLRLFLFFPYFLG